MDRNVKKENALFSAQSTLVFVVISRPRTEKIILQNIFEVLNSTCRRPIWYSSKSRLSKYYLLGFFIIYILGDIIITQYSRITVVKTSKDNLFLTY